MILALSDSFGKLLTLQVLASRTELDYQEPRKTGITKKGGLSDSIFIIQIPILLYGRIWKKEHHTSAWLRIRLVHSTVVAASLRQVPCKVARDSGIRYRAPRRV